MKGSITNAAHISAKDIPAIVKMHWKKKQPVIFFGSPGIGKSAQIYSAAKEIATEENLKFKESPSVDEWENPETFGISTILSSQLDELDTKGALWVQRREGHDPVASFTATDLFPEIGKGILFMDEFANGQPHILNALQPILLEGITGNKRVSKDILFVLASNKPDDNTGTNFIPMALRNRMATYVVDKMDMDEWFEVMRNINRPITPEIEAFLRTFEKYYYTFDASKISTYAYASPRTWDKANHMIVGVESTPLKAQIISSWCGEDVGTQFESFIKLSAKVDMKDLIKNPDKIRDYEHDIGLLYSISINLVNHALKDTKSAIETMKVIDKMHKDEFGVFIIKQLMTQTSSTKVLTMLKSDPVGNVVATRLAKLLTT